MCEALTLIQEKNCCIQVFHLKRLSRTQNKSHTSICSIYNFGRVLLSDDMFAIHQHHAEFDRGHEQTSVPTVRAGDGRV